MKHYGERIGYAHYAKAITFTKGGAAVKGNNAYLKAEILSLRYDPEISALVKAYQILDETQMLQNMKGAKPTTTDHYIAHMLGLPLAKEFYRLKRQGSIFTLASVSNPQMREAVRMNKGFFYHKGRPLTAAASYRRFEKIVGAELKKIEAASSATPTPICLAQ
jgi:hypothetical protein